MTSGRSLLLAVLLLPACAAPSRGERRFPVPAIEWAPRHYVCRFTEAPPAIDGRLDDAAWAAAPVTEDFTDIEGDRRPAPRFRTRARMLWDEANLYVAAEMEEPDVFATLTERDSVIFHDPDFEVFLDPDGDTHEYVELEVNALGTEWDLLIPYPYRDGGHGVDGFDLAGLRTAVHVDGTRNRPGDEDRGWSVEIAIPWRAVAQVAGRDVPPAPGDVWRANFSRVEWRLRVVGDGYEKVPGVAEDNWVWSPQGLVDMHYPEMWGFVVFARDGRGEGDFAPSAADRAAWILRRVYYLEREHRERHGRFTDRLAGVPAEVSLHATPNRFEATLDGVRITENGRVRAATAEHP